MPKITRGLEGIARFDKEAEPLELLRFQTMHHHEIGRRGESTQSAAIGEQRIDLRSRKQGKFEELLASGDVKIQWMLIQIF